MLGNLSRDLILSQKCLLYRVCVLSITLYGFPLWFYNKVSLAYLLKVLRNMQYRAALWILEAFCTSPLLDIETIADLILIHLHFQKLGGRLQLQTHLLPSNYIIKLLLESRHFSNHNHHQLLMEKLISKQRLKIKGPIVDVNNRLNRIFNSFDSFNNKISPRNRLIDPFSSCFSFYFSNRKCTKTRKTHLHKLDEIVFNTLANPKTAIVILDASIKNKVSMSITHIYVHNFPVVKTIYHTINITFTEAELFAIKCGLNQAIQLTNIEYIFVITNSIHAAKKIFNLFIYSYQIQTLAIFKKNQGVFCKKHHNSLEFWDCPSQDKWSLYDIVNKETKELNLPPIFPNIKQVENDVSSFR